MNESQIPQERDLPAGRLTKLKEDLMAQIEHDLETGAQPARVVTPRRWRRIALTAAAVAAVSVLATSLVIGGGSDSASANTAERTADGAILISIHEAKHPKDLQRRLTDLGVPAVVDFLESGFGCDLSRATGWVEDGRSEELFTHAPDSPDGDPRYVLDPDELQPGETVVLEFQLDEFEDEIAVNANLRLSTSPVGPCEPVPDGSIVDAEEGIAGG